MTYRLHRKPTLHYQIRLKATISSAIACLTAAALGPVIVHAAETATPTTPVTVPNVIINEIKTGGGNTTPSEFVIVYNAGDTAIDIASWTLEYAKPTYPAAQCTAASWNKTASSAANSVTLTGTLAPHSTSSAFILSMNNDVAGAVRLLDSKGMQTDLVGWGSDTAAAPCAESQPAPLIKANSSLVRYLACDVSQPVDSNSNKDDFYVQSAPVITGSASQPSPACTPVTSPSGPDAGTSTTSDNTTAGSSTSGNSTAAQPLPCQHVSITEIEPNPAGADSGAEFIELHNLSAAANDLSGCSLQTSSNSKTFSLANIVLAADEYHSYTNTDSGLTLPNTSGGKVWLIWNNQEIQTVEYPAGMDDDTSWTYADGLWATSYTPTPNVANLLTATKPCAAGEIRNSDTNRCVSIASRTDDTGLTPCEAGQERNPETNRCRAIATTAATSCPAGQERNPSTNRCRAITTATTSLTACKAGQERNPDTNRCRAIASSTTSSLTPCPAGQERNPSTNRCKKITAAASSQNGKLANVEDATGGHRTAGKPYWLIAAFVMLAAISYGIYEWRQELRQFLTKRSSRLKSKFALQH